MIGLRKFVRLKFEGIVSGISILLGVSFFIFGKGDTWIGIIPILSGALLMNHIMRALGAEG